MRLIPKLRVTRIAAVFLAAAWLFGTAASAQMSSRMSTRFLARGEQALLEVAVTGGQPVAFPEIPAIENVEVIPASRGAQTRLLPGRKLEYIFEYLVSSYEVGTHVIPSLDMQLGGIRFRSQPVEFQVFNPDDLEWSEAVAGSTRFRYASAFRTLNSTPFEGETTPVEIKIFLPAELLVDDFGIPDFERDGLTAWRFQPSSLRGRINLLGLPYVSIAYPSTLTPTRSGAIGIGPASIRLIITQMVLDGTMRRANFETYLKVPKLALESMPLPPGAPEGFENAVGSFDVSVTTSLTDVQEGEPIPLDIFVTGIGNLDTLRPPKPVNSEGWKLYEATTDSRGEERRELFGNTIFRQFMRPLTLKQEIPSFRLVYFDPKLKAYKSILTEPIALNMTPAPAPMVQPASPPQALAMPVERMTDILGLIQPASLTVPAGFALPGWIGHAIGGLLAAILILKAFWMRIRPRLRKNPLREARLSALREVERIPAGDDGAFLMAAGRFIERFQGQSPSPDAQAVLTERDSLCFRSDAPTSGLLSPKRRSEILRILKSSITACLAVWFLGLSGQPLMAADAVSPAAPSAEPASLAQRASEAYDSARFTEAIELWMQAGPFEKLSADTLFNIGNASYRAGSAGHAALFFRRALARDPSHQESRQNLRFIERKYGAITIHRPEYQYALARVPLSVWKGTVWSGAWFCVLALLVFPATRPGARLRVAAIAALIVGPLLIACGGLGWRYFPDDSEFAPLERQAVIIADDAVLHADASRTSPEVIDAPVGSLAEIIKKSGRWAYVAFATKTRGWIPVESIEPVIPSGPLKPLQPRKPKVDGKSA
jgi:hypothetical protein